MNPVDFVFISMPYSKFDSRWFANVPNINLGIMNALMKEKGIGVETFHFHLFFQDFLRRFGGQVEEKFIALSQSMGVEFLGLDYVFASLLFEKDYLASRSRFEERLEILGLNLEIFEELRDVAQAFIADVYAQISSSVERAKLVGFSCSHYQLSASMLLCRRIKEANPGIRTVFGGKDCSGTFAKELLQHMDVVDFVGIGECEITILNLLEHLEDPNKPLVNVAHRNGSGTPELAPLKKNVSLKTLPFPSYDFRKTPLRLEDIILPLEFGRGCPWKKCTFCPDLSYNMTCQSKTSEQIKNEVSYYNDAAEALRNFIILDSDALKDPALIVQLASYLEKGTFYFHFAEFRAEWMSRDVLSALSRFGTWVSPFQVGIETFSEKLLSLMNKGVTALKNVEVLKGAAELGVKLQFNLFTCYPNMTWVHMKENLDTMDKISHLLVRSNIEAYPGEFYLPTDCPVFLDMDAYNLERNEESIFADVFEDFSMASYSNYPFPYEFENDEEQFEMARALREKVEEIKGKDPEGNYMHFEESGMALHIVKCRDGVREEYTAKEVDKTLYMSAVKEIRTVAQLAQELHMKASEVSNHLKVFEKKGLVLLSPNDDAFLSLATAK